MLYLDSSALVKVYFKEIGTEAVIARAIDLDEEVCTSVLTFAEVQSALARRYRERLLTSQELAKGRESFERDWSILLNVVELNLQTMAALPNLVEQFRLKAADAIHLSTAIWLNRMMQSEDSPRVKEVLEFGVADRDLADIAGQCGLRIFNPEDQA
jgi:predicted nucleic acid-binding protein